MKTWTWLDRTQFLNVGFFCCLEGLGFFCKKKFIINNLQAFSGCAGLSETFLEQSHQTTLHGIPMSPSWLRAVPWALLVCVPYQGQMMAWQAAPGCSKWLVIPGWWIAATLSWACGSAALSLCTRLLGKGGHSLCLSTCPWQSSGTTAPHLSSDTAVSLKLHLQLHKKVF